MNVLLTQLAAKDDEVKDMEERLRDIIRQKNTEIATLKGIAMEAASRMGVL